MSEEQSRFAEALLDPRAARPSGLADAQGNPAQRRFDVYRNNVVVSLTEALESGFPVVAKLLGADNMKGLARLYARAHPPEDPLLVHYGAGFPEFLAGMEALGHLPYLPDMARLDLALRRAYHAADAAAIDPGLLAATSPDDLMRSRLGLAPAVSLLRSDWPIHDIWRFNSEPDAPKPSAGAQDVLVARPGFDPLPLLLPPGGAAWVAALQRGETFEAALDAAAAEAPDFDLSASLALLLRGDALISLTTEGR